MLVVGRCDDVTSVTGSHKESAHQYAILLSMNVQRRFADGACAVCVGIVQPACATAGPDRLPLLPGAVVRNRQACGLRCRQSCSVARGGGTRAWLSCTLNGI